MPTLKSVHFLPIRKQVKCKVATLVHKCVNGRALEYHAESCHPSIDQRPGIRSAVNGKLHVLCMQTSFGDRSFAIAGPHTWNNLPDAVRDLFVSLTAEELVIFNRCLINVLTNQITVTE